MPLTEWRRTSPRDYIRTTTAALCLSAYSLSYTRTTVCTPFSHITAAHRNDSSTRLLDLLLVELALFRELA